MKKKTKILIVVLAILAVPAIVAVVGLRPVPPLGENFPPPIITNLPELDLPDGIVGANYHFVDTKTLANLWRGFLLQDEAQKPPLAGGKQGFLQRSIAAKSPPRYSRINRWSNTALKAKNWCKKFYALYDTCKDYIEDFSCTVDEDTGEVSTGKN